MVVSERLCDVTGLRYDSDGFLIRVALAAECVWGPQGQIRYDFENLLLVRADLRVMVGLRWRSATAIRGVLSGLRA